jgi:hypothetical protein
MNILDQKTDDLHSNARVKNKQTPFLSSDPYTITLLQAPPNRPQSKLISPQSSSYASPPLVWGVHLINCPKIEILAQWLTLLENEHAVILIRGCPNFEVSSYLTHPSQLAGAIAAQNERWAQASVFYRNLSRAKQALKTTQVIDEIQKREQEIEGYYAQLSRLGWYPRSKSYFQETPRSWVCLDLDEGLYLPNALALSHEVDHHAGMRWIIQKALPPEFHHISFVGQWSSSAFLKEEKLVKGHFSFLLNRPLGEEDWKHWMGKDGKNWPLPWDPATYRTVQPHFTSKPIFNGIENPLPKRTFFVVNANQYIEIDEISLIKLKQSNDAPKTTPKKIKPATVQSSVPIKKIKEEVPKIDDFSSFEQILENTTEGIRALEAQKNRVISCEIGQRNSTLYQSACSVGRFIGGKQLNLSLAISELLSAAQQCGLLKDQGKEDCVRQIKNGIYWGIKRPISAVKYQHLLDLNDKDYQRELQSKISHAIYQAQLNPKKVPILALTCGAGKTTALCAQVARDAEQGKTRIVLCRNHEMVEAFSNELWAYAKEHHLRLKGRVRVLEGMTRACRVFQEADDGLRKKLQQSLKLGRQAMCGQGKTRCPFAKDCHVSQQPKVLAKGLTIATHSMGKLLNIPKNAVVIIDELPSPVDQTVISSKDLQRLVINTNQLSLLFEDSHEGWLNQNPQLIQAVTAILNRFQAVLSAKTLTSESSNTYAHLIQAEQAFELFKNHIDDFKPLASKAVTSLIKPSALQIRQGMIPKNQIDPNMIEMLELLAQKLVNDGQWPKELCIQWKNQEIWFEYRKPYSLPQGALVALDGTAHRTEMLWQYLLKPLDKIADIWSIAAIGKAPLFSRWIKTQQFRSPQLIKREEGMVIWRNRAIASLKRAVYSILQAAIDAQLKSNDCIGILASKHIADLFRLSFHQACLPAFQYQHPFVQEMVQCIQEVLSGYQVKIGHIGAHDIGSNLYEDVALLAMLGSSKPDWGATLQDLSAIGLPQQEALDVYTQLVSARDVQALARARHLRRDGIALLYIGDMTPPTGHDLPDVHWTQVEAAHPKVNMAILNREQQAVQILMKDGFVTVPDLMKKLGITRAQGISLCQRLERQLELVQWKVNHGKGRPSIAYGLKGNRPSYPFFEF